MADSLEKEKQAVENNMTEPELDNEEPHLHDDKSEQPSEFVGATLQLGGEAGNAVEPDVEFAGPGARPTSAPGLSRDRPGSAFGRKSTVSTGSRTSMSVSVRESDFTTGKYFCKKDGSFEAAVEAIQATIIKNELDGNITGAWLLCEVDHWDNEREKILIITENSMLNVRFDFITNKVTYHQRIMLHIINRIQIGDIQYPAKSLMQPRDHGAIRIHWGDETQLSFGQRWNPWCSDIPYTTLSHHKIIYNEKERETITYNVDDFYESLVQAINNAYKAKKPEAELKIEEGPIMVDTYASLSSMIFNQSHIGFNRDRGGVSF